MADATADLLGGFVRFVGHALPCPYFAMAAASNGRLYAVPAPNGRVIEIDPVSGMMQEFGEPLQSRQKRTVTAASNGCLYSLPFGAGRVLEIRPVERIVHLIGPELGDLQHKDQEFYEELTAASNGCLYAAPSSPGQVLEVNPVTSQVLLIGPRIEDNAPEQYMCLTAAPNGRLYAPPASASAVLAVNPSSREVHSISVPPDAPAFYSATLAHNGKMYAAPNQEVLEDPEGVLEIDLHADTAKYIGPSLSGYGWFTTLRAAPDGTLWAMSCNKGLSSAGVLKIDPSTGVVEMQSIAWLLQGGPMHPEVTFEDWALAGNGRLYATPEAAGARILEFDPVSCSGREIGASPLPCGYKEPVVAQNGRVFALPRVPYQRVLQVDYHTLSKPGGKILSTLHDLLTAGDMADVAVKTTQGKTYRAHKLILAMRSRVFRSMFATNMREAQDALVELGDVSPWVSDMFMKFLYTDDAQAHRVSLQELCELGSLAHRYEIEDLVLCCIAPLKANLAVNNAAQLLRFADQLQLSELKDACLDFVVANPVVADTEEWEQLPSALVREAFAAVAGKRSKKRKRSEWEFPAETAWSTLSTPMLRRACAERGLAQDGNMESLIQRLQG